MQDLLQQQQQQLDEQRKELAAQRLNASGGPPVAVEMGHGAGMSAQAATRLQQDEIRVRVSAGAAVSGVLGTSLATMAAMSMR